MNVKLILFIILAIVSVVLSSVSALSSEYELTYDFANWQNCTTFGHTDLVDIIFNKVLTDVI